MGALFFNRYRGPFVKKKRKTARTTKQYEWTDAQLLAALDLTECGLSRSETAQLLSTAHDRPFTRMSVTGAIDRIRKETNAVPCFCEKPENRDGGMPANWWHR